MAALVVLHLDCWAIRCNVAPLGERQGRIVNANNGMQQIVAYACQTSHRPPLLDATAIGVGGEGWFVEAFEDEMVQWLRLEGLGEEVVYGGVIQVRAIVTVDLIRYRRGRSVVVDFCCHNSMMMDGRRGWMCWSWTARYSV